MDCNVGINKITYFAFCRRVDFVRQKAAKKVVISEIWIDEYYPRDTVSGVAKSAEIFPVNFWKLVWIGQSANARMWKIQAMENPSGLPQPEFTTILAKEMRPAAHGKLKIVENPKGFTTTLSLPQALSLVFIFFERDR